MSRLDVLSKEPKETIQDYLEIWKRVTPNDDPLLKCWKQHIDSNKRCGNK